MIGFLPARYVGEIFDFSGHTKVIPPVEEVISPLHEVDLGMASAHQDSLFGTATRTNILMAIHLLQETHASEIAQALNLSLSTVQKAVDGLEVAGLVAGVRIGRERRVTLNPRYFALADLKILLDSVSTQDVGLHQKLATIRRRPRRAGKAI